MGSVDTGIQLIGRVAVGFLVRWFRLLSLCRLSLSLLLLSLLLLSLSRLSLLLSILVRNALVGVAVATEDTGRNC